MNLTTRVCLAAGSVFGLVSVCAALPPVLDQVPANAAIVVTIPNPAQLEKNLQSLTTATQLPIPPLGVQDMLNMAGIMEGVEVDKGMAVIISAPTDAKEHFEPGEGNTVVLIPVKSYADLIKNFESKAKEPGAATNAPTPGGGVDELTAPDGKDVFARDLKNGYAIIGETRGAVEGFKPAAPGAGAAIGAAAGPAGSSLLDSGDLLLVLNVDAMRPFIGEAMAKAKEAAKERMAAMPIPGAEGASPADQLDSPLAKWVQERISTDTRMLVGGMKMSSLGVRLDMTAGFVKDSYMAKACATGGAAEALLKQLPNQPYIFAMAMDTSSAALKQLVKDLGAKAKESRPAEAEQAFDPMAMYPPISDMDGMSMVMGFSPAMLMGGGMFTSSVAYIKSSKPDAAVLAMKTGIEKLDGVEDETVSIKTKYVEGGATVGESKTPVDLWEMKIRPKAGGPQVNQMMAMMFGPSGAPSGYIAKTGGGYYVTYARNSDLMAKALGAANGDNLLKDQMIGQVAEQLPGGRIMEMHLGTKAIFDTAIPMLSMMGGIQIDPSEMPETMPPIAMAMAAKDGSAQMTMFLPAPVLKTGAMVAQKAMEARTGMEQDGADEAAPGEGPDGDKPGEGGGATGQPKF